MLACAQHSSLLLQASHRDQPDPEDFFGHAVGAHHPTFHFQILGLDSRIIAIRGWNHDAMVGCGMEGDRLFNPQCGSKFKKDGGS